MPNGESHSHGAPPAPESSPESETSLQKGPNASLQFVQMTDTGELDAKSRRIVRAHVMKDYDKRLTAARKKNIGTDSVPPSQALLGFPSRKRANEGLHRWRPALTPDLTQPRNEGKGAIRTGQQGLPMEITSMPAGGIKQASDDSFESWPSAASLWDNSDPAAYKSILPSNESKTWDPGNEEVKIKSKDISLGTVGILGLLSPPVHKLGIRNGHLDPFNTLPVPAERTEVLVTHFHSRIFASSLMMSARKHWFILATGDEALFLIAMSHAAGNLSLQQQKSTWDAPEALILRSEAIRVINERILHIDAKGPSDGTVGAVASIASYEATNGSPQSIRTHMAGLSQMVGMRGGLIDGVWDPAILRLILWADLNSANALNVAPYFVYPSIILSSASRHDPLPLLILRGTDAQFEDTACLMLLPGPLSFALLDLRYLLKVIQFSRSGGSTALNNLDDLRYSDKVYLVQRKLMELTSMYNSQLFDNRIPDEFEEVVLIAAPAAIASLIFVECILREISPSARIIGSLLSRLTAAIEHVDFLQQKQSPSETAFTSQSSQKLGILRVMLWIFAVGGTVAKAGADGLGNDNWWVRRLRALVNVLFPGPKAEVEGDVNAALKSVVWPDGEGSSTRWMGRWNALFTAVKASN